MVSIFINLDYEPKLRNSIAAMLNFLLTGRRDGARKQSVLNHGLASVLIEKIVNLLYYT